jgi:MFS family permease
VNRDWRHLDSLVIAGVALSAVGSGALLLEIKARGLRGFVTSYVDLGVVSGLLVLAAATSWWAFDRADGWWRLLAGTGVVISALALLVPVVLLLVQAALESPDVFNDKSRSRRKRTRRRRRSGRAYW